MVFQMTAKKFICLRRIRISSLHDGSITYYGLRYLIQETVCLTGLISAIGFLHFLPGNEEEQKNNPEDHVNPVQLKK